MFRTSVKGVSASLLLVTAFTLTSAHAKHDDLSMKVIYGSDDRKDLYELDDAGLKGLVASTVALMKSNDVIITGSRAMITEDIFGPGYGLCENEPYYHQNSAAFCSGFLVAPDTIVTAGHCVTSEGQCKNTKFVFGFAMHSPTDRATEVPANDVYECKELVHSVARGDGEDFAVIKLTRSVNDRRPARVSKVNAEVGTALTVIGHPSGLPVKIAGGAKVREVKAQYMIANLDTYGGNSGSAVFNTNTGNVEGILVRGERDFIYENGCRRSNVCTDSGCRGEDVTLIKQALPYLAQ